MRTGPYWNPSAYWNSKISKLEKFCFIVIIMLCLCNSWFKRLSQRCWNGGVRSWHLPYVECGVTCGDGKRCPLEGKYELARDKRDLFVRWPQESRAQGSAKWEWERGLCMSDRPPGLSSEVCFIWYSWYEQGWVTFKAQNYRLLWTSACCITLFCFVFYKSLKYKNHS